MGRTQSFGKNKLSIVDKIIYYFRVKKIEEHYNFDSKSIIDLGCGYNAKFLLYIKENYKTKNLIAFDLQLNKEYLKSQGIKSYVGDFNKGFSIDEKIDIAIGTAILEHLSNPIGFLTSCYNILPKGGYLLLTVPTARAKPVLEFIAYKLHIIDREDIEDHKKYYKKDSLIEALELAGFDKKNIKHSYFELFMNNFVLVKNNMKIKKLYSYKFIRYSIGGGLAALLDLILLYLLTDCFKIYYLLSAIISFIISVTFGYIFQKYITFKDTSKRHIKQGGLFILFQLIGQGIYLLILRLGVDVLGFYYMLVAITGKLIAFIRNYLSNRYFNFKK